MKKILSAGGARGAFVFIGTLCVVGLANAQAADLPWAKPLEEIGDLLQGPVAKAIGTLAVAASGGMLAFGGELGDFTKRLMMVVLAISSMVLASSFMDLLPSSE